ncbi:flagellar hook-length control protein FliK [Sporosalibacterium faouarense]|uniref:flagellar hook-length control protein FliK n=1 Tax=Sporosalibacterium faouarense TaxID=516123 RepID=UPI00192C6AC8
MKINSVNSNTTQNTSNNGIKLGKGDIVKGKVISIDGDNALIELKDGTQLSGKALVPMNKFQGKTISLLVRQATDTKLVFTPVAGGVEDQSEKSFVRNILKEIGLIDSEKDQEILKTLVKYKMPINQDSIDRVSIALDKIEELLNIKEGESLELISNKGNPLDEDVSKLIKSSVNGLEVQGGSLNSDEITELITKTLENMNINKEIDSNIIKEVTFLVKNNGKVSVNNLKFLSDIISNKDFFEGDLLELVQQMDDEGYDVKDIKLQFSKLQEGKILNFDSSDKEILKESINKLTKLIDDIQKSVNTNENKSDTISDKINNLNSKIDFLNNLNENSTFFYIPLKMKKEDLQKNLFVLNKKKRFNKGDKVRIFVSLDTTNLDKVNVMLESNNSKLKIDFNVRSKAIVEFIETRINELGQVLSDSGYDNIDISINTRKEDDINPLDLIADEEGQNYLFDVRV